MENSKPILFNTEMVKAIIKGRKTVTRRVVKFPKGMTGRLPESGAKDYIYYPGGIKRPPYQVGDTLYVRETFRYVSIGEVDYFGECMWDDEVIQFKASEDEFNKKYKDLIGEYHEWKPSIHMPKSAARIFLKVTDIRVERLQDINGQGHHNDILKEGIKIHSIPDACLNHTGYTFGENCRDTPIQAFIDLWNSTIKKSELGQYGWDANPYVFVIEFERVDKVED